MAKTNPRTILLKGEVNRRQSDAAATITPGDLLELTSSGTVQRHSDARGFAGLRYFAVENDIVGDGIDDNYAATEAVQYQAARPGEEILASIADGEVIAIGDMLISNGSGKLIKSDEESAGTHTQSIVAVALAALDLSDSTGADPVARLRVQVV